MNLFLTFFKNFGILREKPFLMSSLGIVFVALDDSFLLSSVMLRVNERDILDCLISLMMIRLILFTGKVQVKLRDEKRVVSLQIIFNEFS